MRPFDDILASTIRAYQEQMEEALFGARLTDLRWLGPPPTKKQLRKLNRARCWRRLKSWRIVNLEDGWHKECDY